METKYFEHLILYVKNVKRKILKTDYFWNILIKISKDLLSNYFKNILKMHIFSKLNGNKVLKAYNFLYIN